jgi:hypothetical protein
VCYRCKKSKRRRSRQLINPACDPFADTVLDYAYNLAASGAIVVPDYIYGYNNSRSLIRMLLQRELGPAPTLALRKKDDDEIDKAVAQALAGFLKASKRENRKVSAPRAHAGANLRLIAKTLGFSAVEAAVLQFAVPASREDMQELLDPISCVGLRVPAIHIAAATGLDREEVYAALDRKGPLVMSGLIMLNDHGDLDDRVLVDRRLEGIVLAPNLDAASFVDRFLPAAPPASPLGHTIGRSERSGPAMSAAGGRTAPRGRSPSPRLSCPRLHRRFRAQPTAVA